MTETRTAKKKSKAPKNEPCTVIVTEDEHLSSDALGIQMLLSGFGEGDLNKVRDALNMLGKAEEQGLHVKVGEMTETFHRSLKVLHSNLDPAHLTMTTTNIPDAARKLEYVLNATNEAAHKLLGLVGRQEQLLNQADETFKTFQTRMKDAATPAEADKNVAQLSADWETWVSDSRAILSDMVVSQEFQDLCGQALSKVLKLVRELETSLSHLVKNFGMESSSQEAAASPDDTKIDQQNADDLLKQFGF